MASKKDKDLAAAMALMASVAAEVGVDLGEVDPVDTHYEAEVKQDKLKEVDGVMTSLEYPHRMMTKICKGCGQPFQTNYRAAGCCSTACRRGWFNRSVGIDWDFSRKPTWGEYEPPLVISAETYSMMMTWATTFLEQAEELRSRIPESTPEPESPEFPQEFQLDDHPAELSIAQWMPAHETQQPDYQLAATQTLATPPTPLDTLEFPAFDF